MLVQIKDMGLSLQKDADKSKDGPAKEILSVVDATIDLWTKMVRRVPLRLVWQ